MISFKQFLAEEEEGVPSVAAMKRQGLTHLNLMKPDAFLTWLESVKKDAAGLLGGHNVKAALKIDGMGCLHYDTEIDTLEYGGLPIGKIVEKDLRCHVKSWDGTEIVYEKILGTRELEANDDWYEIELENGAFLKVTGNHLVFVENLNCWRRVDELDLSNELMFTV